MIPSKRKLAIILFAVGASTSLVTTHVWSSINQEKIGIYAVREFGKKHLFTWRGPTVVERATGADRWLVHEKLKSEIPQRVLSNAQSRDTYQKEIFFGIIQKYPWAFLQDTLIGSLKILLNRAKDTLQTFFPSSFENNTEYLDFLGFNRRILNNIYLYAPVAPLYFVILFISAILTTATVIGAVCTLSKLPSALIETKLILLTLFAWSDILVLSSSSSLDARFRVPLVRLQS